MHVGVRFPGVGVGMGSSSGLYRRTVIVKPSYWGTALQHLVAAEVASISFDVALKIVPQHFRQLPVLVNIGLPQQCSAYCAVLVPLQPSYWGLITTALQHMINPGLIRKHADELFKVSAAGVILAVSVEADSRSAASAV